MESGKIYFIDIERGDCQILTHAGNIYFTKQLFKNNLTAATCFFKPFLIIWKDKFLFVFAFLIFQDLYIY